MSKVVGPFSPQMVAALLGGKDDDYETSIMPEAQVETLKEYNVKYQKAMISPPKFSPGDMITPVAGVGTKGVGQPHIVLEVRSFSKVEPFWSKDASSSGNGRRLDIRVACFVNNESISTFWVESIEYEPYTE